MRGEPVLCDFGEAWNSMKSKSSTQRNADADNGLKTNSCLHCLHSSCWISYLAGQENKICEKGPHTLHERASQHSIKGKHFFSGRVHQKSPGSPDRIIQMHRIIHIHVVACRGWHSIPSLDDFFRPCRATLRDWRSPHHRCPRSQLRILERSTMGKFYDPWVVG